MRHLLYFALFATLVANVSAQTAFEIGTITIEKMPTVNRDQKPLTFAATRLSVPADMASSEFIFMAHYFSESGELVSASIPGQIIMTKDRVRVSTGRNPGSAPMPEKLEAGKKYEVHFGAPSGVKWKRVIVVAGKKGDMVGKIYPKDDWSKFDFPDKASVRQLQ
jgi:hypothetical protein